MSLFEVKLRHLHFGFFSKFFLKIYFSSFFIVPLYHGFYFFLDVFSFYFFFFVSSFVKNIYFHSYLSLVLFFDLDLFISFYLSVLNSNNNTFFIQEHFTTMFLCIFWVFLMDLLFYRFVILASSRYFSSKSLNFVFDRHLFHSFFNLNFLFDFIFLMKSKIFYRHILSIFLNRLILFLLRYLRLITYIRLKLFNWYSVLFKYLNFLAGIFDNFVYFYFFSLFRRFFFNFLSCFFFFKYYYYFRFFFNFFDSFKGFFFSSRFLKSFFLVSYSFSKYYTIISSYGFRYFAYIVLLNLLSFDKVFYLPTRSLLKNPKYLELEEKLDPDNEVFWEFIMLLFWNFLKIFFLFLNLFLIIFLICIELL
jgi:hypothetical protein